MGDDPDTRPARPEAHDPDDFAARPKPYGANDSTAPPGPRAPDAVAARPPARDADGPPPGSEPRDRDLAVRPQSGDADALAVRPWAGDADDPALRSEACRPDVSAARSEAHGPVSPAPRSGTLRSDASAARSQAHGPVSPVPGSEALRSDASAARSQAHGPDSPAPRSETHRPGTAAAQSAARGPDSPAPRHPDAPAVQPHAHDADEPAPRSNPRPQADDLVTRLKAYEGLPAAVAGVGKDPVNLPMIRHWCEALGDANPVYTGPDAVAPPTMLQAWTMGGLTGHTGRSSAYDELLALLDESGCTSVVATDCEQEYLQPLRPGDRITFDTVIESVSDRKTTKLGTGHFVTTRTDVRVGVSLVGTHRFRILKYAPAQRKNTPPRSQRPRPVVNRDNAGFWDGVEQHRLLLQRCTSCAALRFPWLPGCARCGGPDWATVEASGEGTVHSYVVMHHPPFPAFDPPYAVVLVELAEGVRMISNVVGTPYDKVRIGMPVRLVFRTYDGDLTLPVFRAAAEEAAV
jgi:uncharacterized OB-fold protein